MAETDLSKIVNLIMENPKLIEEIKNLGAGESKTEEEAKSEESAEVKQAEEATSETAATVTSNESTARIRRRELLSALKPYVSEGRGKAIDSMMSIADILDMMRTK